MLKSWTPETLETGGFLHNMLANQRAIVDCAALNEDGVLVTSADNGSLWCADPKTPETPKIKKP